MTRKERIKQELKKQGIYGYIYCITNTQDNNKKYVGQVVAYKGKDRLLENYQKTRNKKYPDSKLKRAFDNFPFDAFIVETIDQASTKEELNEKEKYWIKYYDCINNGYNKVAGGNGGPQGFKHTEEAKKKISDSNKRRVLSKETKEKIGAKNKILNKNSKYLSKKIDMYDYQHNFLKTFPSIKEAMRFLEITNDASIRQILYKNHNRDYCFGFTFEWNKGEDKIQTKTDEEILKMKGKILPKLVKKFQVIDKNGNVYYLAGWKHLSELLKLTENSLRVRLKKSNTKVNGFIFKEIQQHEMPNDYPIGSEHKI